MDLYLAPQAKFSLLSSGEVLEVQQNNVQKKISYFHPRNISCTFISVHVVEFTLNKISGYLLVKKIKDFIFFTKSFDEYTTALLLIKKSF